MYKGVNIKEDLFTATEVKEINGALVESKVIIHKHVSPLYQSIASTALEVDKEYVPILFSNIHVLNCIKNLFTGCLNPAEYKTLGKVYVRYGWLDKKLNSLEWVSVLELYERFANNQLGKTDKGKLVRVLQQITLSKRDAIKYDLRQYMVDAQAPMDTVHYDPRPSLDESFTLRS